MELRNHVALVTGASRGLGLAIAQEYAGRGAKLAITARGEGALAVAAAVLGRRTEVLALPGNVADPAHAGRLVDATLARFGRIDVLVNNASELGPTPLPPLAALEPIALESVFRINTAAPLRLIQLVLPGMLARGEGLIVNVTSDAAVNAYPGWGGYGASKAALEYLSRVLAEELAGTGIRIYAVDPGDMDTEMHRAAVPDADPATLGQPEAVAVAFAWLAERQDALAGRFEAASLAAGKEVRSWR